MPSFRRVALFTVVLFLEVVLLLDFFFDLRFDFLSETDLLVLDKSESSLYFIFKSLLALLRIPPTILDFGFLLLITVLIPSSLSESELLEI